jgi:hypothetical protein
MCIRDSPYPDILTLIYNRKFSGQIQAAETLKIRVYPPLKGTFPHKRPKTLQKAY